MKWSGTGWNRALEVTYCFVAGVVFSFALQVLHGVDGQPVAPVDIAFAILFPLTNVIGWGSFWVLAFWPVLTGLVFLHYRRPSLAGLLTISLVTAAAFLRSVQGLHTMMSV